MCKIVNLKAIRQSRSHVGTLLGRGPIPPRTQSERVPRASVFMVLVPTSAQVATNNRLYEPSINQVMQLGGPEGRHSVHTLNARAAPEGEMIDASNVNDASVRYGEADQLTNAMALWGGDIQ